MTPFYGLTFRTIPASLHHFCQSLFKVLEMLGYFFTCNLDIYQHPAAVRLPLVTVSGRAAALFVVLERCNAESVFSLVSIRDPQRLPFSFRSGTLRTLVIVSERSHTTVNLFTLVLFFSQLQQLRCVLIASPKVPRKAPLLCLFVRVTVFTNCQRFQCSCDLVILPPH